MLLIQLTGLSGSGKSTIAAAVKELLRQHNFPVEIIDGDIYRKKLCPDLGFSKEDRHENIRRLGFVGNLLASNKIITILAAINPYENIRKELKGYGAHVKTVWINCDLETLLKRDTKQLYKKAMLPDSHPEKISNLTGVNDPYEIPENPDLVINSDVETEQQSAAKLYNFIIGHLNI
ncbi:MAG TPA: adenylyl-sulfate kinase [Chitinophagaceae bacterium]